MFDQVKLDRVRHFAPRHWPLATKQQAGADRFDSCIEFLALVTSDSDPVAEQKAKQKGREVQRNELTATDEAKGFKELLQWLAQPLLWLLAGLFVGGALDRPRRR